MELPGNCVPTQDKYMLLWWIRCLRSLIHPTIYEMEKFVGWIKRSESTEICVPTQERGNARRFTRWRRKHIKGRIYELRIGIIRKRLMSL